jgi:hypothetical protein
MAKLADDAHEPVLYLLPKQNRELPYASQRSKPCKVQIKLLSRWNKLVIKIKQACEEMASLRQSR